jgi:SSS family solute:Na+ symporter
VSCLLFSLFKAEKIVNIKDYSLGNRRFSVVSMVATIFATGINAATILSIAENMNKKGFYIAIIVMLRPIYWVLTGYIVSRNLHKLQGCITIADVIQKLYGGISGKIVTISGVILSVGVCTGQFTAIFSILSFISNNNTALCIVLLSVIVIYSSFGGIYAVVRTDLIQFILFYTIFPLICGVYLFKIGGIDSLALSLGKDYFTLPSKSPLLEDFITLIIYTLVPEIDPPHIQRILMQKTKKNVMKIYKIISIISLPFYISIIILGLCVANHSFHNIEDNYYFLEFIKQHIPEMGFNLTILGLLAITMSTADSYLNTSGILVSRFISKVFKLKSTELRIARISCFLIGVFIIPIAIKGIFLWKISFFSYTFWYPIIVVPLISCLWGIKSNQYSFYSSVIGAVIFILATALLKGEIGSTTISYGMLGSLIGFLLAQNNKALIKKIYNSGEQLLKGSAVLDETIIIILLLYISVFYCLFPVIYIESAIMIMFCLCSTIIIYARRMIGVKISLKLRNIIYILSYLYISTTFFVHKSESITLFTKSCYLLYFGVSIFCMKSMIVILCEIIIFSITSLPISTLSQDKIELIFLTILITMLFIAIKFLLLGIKKRLLLSKIQLDTSNNIIHQKSISISQLESSKIAEKKYYNLIKEFYLLQESEPPKCDSNSLSITVIDSSITEQYDLHEVCKNMKSFFSYRLNENSSSLEYYGQEGKTVDLSIGKAPLYQIMFSLIATTIDLLKKNGKVKIKSSQSSKETIIEVTYSGYALTMQNVRGYSKDKEEINPFLLNWDELLKSLVAHHFIV